MSYTRFNFPTKAALRRAVAARADLAGSPFPNDPVVAADLGRANRELTLQHTSIVGNEPTDGEAFLEGPHYPRPHTWYAKVQVKDGVVVKVLS